MTSLKYICGLFALSATWSLVLSQTTETVATEYGNVIGDVMDVTMNYGTFPVSSFYGVPYAKAPVGDLRFEPPVKQDAWTEDLIANVLPNACMQSPLGILWMTHPAWTKYNEDCLFLNIFKPRNVVAPLPVLVWFHGGGYVGGANVQYPGHFMATRDVIVVTVNYRLGVFGFASSPERLIKGNMGMLDQVAALQFIKDNIANFGGNPNRVTIYGQSAGASSSALHMVSPVSRGLYHQAILESGTENNVWTLNYPPQEPDNYIFQVATKLNCTYTTEAEMVACLKAADARDLRIADNIECTEGYFCQGFAPIVDGPGGFMPELPIKLREKLGADSVPIINGMCRDDGSLYVIYFIPEANNGGFTREEFQFYLRTRLVDIFAASANDEVDVENAYQAMDWYYTPWPYVEDEEANRQAFNKLMTDAAFGYPWDRTSKINAENRDTYTYIQSFLSPNSTSFIPAWMGVPHNGELPYTWAYANLLNNPTVRDNSGIHFDIVGWVPEDTVYADYVQTLWSNFAKYGNPTPSPVMAPFNNTLTTWPKFSMTDNLKVLNLDGTIKVEENYRQQERYFYTEYMSYISKHEVKSAAPVTPRKKFQLKASMFQDAITKMVYDQVVTRLPSMSHLTYDEFTQIYDI